MSKKFYDRLSQETPSSSTSFHSKFGASILKKFGWTEGTGLGKERDGAVNCLQIKRRAEFQGLGVKPVEKSEQWNNWWSDVYNNAMLSFSVKNVQPGCEEATSSSDDETDDGMAFSKGTYLRAKRNKFDIHSSFEFIPKDEKHERKRSTPVTGLTIQARESDVTHVNNKSSVDTDDKQENECDQLHTVNSPLTDENERAKKKKREKKKKKNKTRTPGATDTLDIPKTVEKVEQLRNKKKTKTVSIENTK